MTGWCCIPGHFDWRDASGTWAIDGWHLIFQQAMPHLVIDYAVFRKAPYSELDLEPTESLPFLKCLLFFFPKWMIEIRDGVYDTVAFKNFKSRFLIQPDQVHVDQGSCQFVDFSFLQASAHNVHFYIEKDFTNRIVARASNFYLQIADDHVLDIHELCYQSDPIQSTVSLQMADSKKWILQFNRADKTGVWIHDMQESQFFFEENPDNCYQVRHFKIDLDYFVKYNLDFVIHDATLCIVDKTLKFDFELLKHNKEFLHGSLTGNWLRDRYQIGLYSLDSENDFFIQSAEVDFSTQGIGNGRMHLRKNQQNYFVDFSDHDRRFYVRDSNQNVLSSLHLGRKKIQFHFDQIQGRVDLASVFPLQASCLLSHSSYGSLGGQIFYKDPDILVDISSIENPSGIERITGTSYLILHQKKDYYLGHIEIDNQSYEMGMRNTQSKKKCFVQGPALEMAVNIQDQEIDCHIMQMDLEKVIETYAFFEDFWKMRTVLQDKSHQASDLSLMKFKIDQCRYAYGQAHHLHGTWEMNHDCDLYQLYGSHLSFVYRQNNKGGDGAFILNQIGAYTSLFDGGPLYLTFYHDGEDCVQWHAHIQDLFLPKMTNEHFTGLNILTGQIFQEQQLRSLWYKGVCFDKVALSGRRTDAYYSIVEGYGQAGCLTIYPTGSYDRKTQKLDLLLAVRPQVSQALSSVLAILQPWTVGLTLPGVHSWGDRINEWNEELYFLRGTFQNLNLIPYEPEVVTLAKS